MASNSLFAFQFWYKSEEYSPTEYIWIIAASISEAQTVFTDHNYTSFYDYGLWPCDEIPQSEFEIPHNQGDILGGNALI